MFNQWLNFNPSVPFSAFDGIAGKDVCLAYTFGYANDNQ